MTQREKQNNCGISPYHREVNGKMPKEFKPGELVCVSHKWGGKTLATIVRIQGKELYWL